MLTEYLHVCLIFLIMNSTVFLNYSFLMQNYLCYRHKIGFHNIWISTFAVLPPQILNPCDATSYLPHICEFSISFFKFPSLIIRCALVLNT